MIIINEGTEVQIPAEAISIFFNGMEMRLEDPPFYAGAALLAASGNGKHLPGPGELPYLFCGNGACRDCSLHVNGVDDVSSCRLPLAASMSFRPGARAGEENALSRNLRGLDREGQEPLEVELLIVGAGPAGAAALEAVRGLGIEAMVADARTGAGSPRPVSVRFGRLAMAEQGFVREVRARIVILATGGSQGREPQLAIAKALGCRTAYDPSLRYERLELDADGRTSIPCVFAAGDAARVGSEREAIESGGRAGAAAAHVLRKTA